LEINGVGLEKSAGGREEITGGNLMLTGSLEQKGVYIEKSLNVMASVC